MLSLRPPSPITAPSWRLLGGIATALAGVVSMCMSISVAEQAPTPRVRPQLRTAQASPIVIASVAILPESDEELAELAAQWVVPPPPVYALFVPKPAQASGAWSV